MNGLLFFVVVMLWMTVAWKNRNHVVTIYLPSLKRKKKQRRQFKSFRYVNTGKGTRCIEEPCRRIA